MMLKTVVCIALLLFVFSTAAQTPSLPATDISAASIKAFIDAMNPQKVTDDPIRIVDVGGYHVGVYGVLRPKTIPQEANVHETKVTEIYYILEGTATLVTGGNLPNRHQQAPGSTTFQGTHIDGGISRKVSKGDVVIIPGRTPHWFSSQEGDLRYLIFRPDPEKELPLK